MAATPGIAAAFAIPLGSAHPMGSMPPPPPIMGSPQPTPEHTGSQAPRLEAIHRAAPKGSPAWSPGRVLWVLPQPPAEATEGLLLGAGWDSAAPENEARHPPELGTAGTLAAPRRIPHCRHPRGGGRCEPSPRSARLSGGWRCGRYSTSAARACASAIPRRIDRNITAKHNHFVHSDSSRLPSGRESSERAKVGCPWRQLRRSAKATSAPWFGVPTGSSSG